MADLGLDDLPEGYTNEPSPLKDPDDVAADPFVYYEDDGTGTTIVYNQDTGEYQYYDEAAGGYQLLDEAQVAQLSLRPRSQPAQATQDASVTNQPSSSEATLLTPGQAGEEVHPLHYAASTGNKKLVAEWLESARQDQDTYQQAVDQADALGRSALVYAAAAGRSSIVSLLIDAKASMDLADSDGRTALSWAIYLGRPKIVALLLKGGANIDTVDIDGKTFLHLMTRSTNTKCFAAISKHVPLDDIKVDLVDNLGMTPLHWASYHNSVNNIKLLLKLGASIRAVDAENKTPIHYAVTASPPTLKALLAADDPVLAEVVNAQDIEQRTALHVAVGLGNIDIVSVLLTVNDIELGLQDADGRTPLHWAVQLGHTEMVSKLLRAGGGSLNATADVNGWTPLHYAVHENFPKCVRELLSHDSQDSQDSHGQSALMLAVSGGHPELVEMLAARDPESLAIADATGNTPLHRAAYDGNNDVVQKLIHANAPLEAKAADQTPLMYACERGHTGVIHSLVNANANPAVADEEGRTCLHVSSMSGHAAICTFLIQECQLDPNHRDLGGRTPLHTAVYSLDESTTEALIAAGADVDAQDGEGISALHWAASRGTVGCLDLLLGASCFPNHTEYHHERLTALDYALMSEHANGEVIATKLREAGGLTVEEVRQLAAQHIQSWWNGFRARSSLLSAWQRFQQGVGEDHPAVRAAEAVADVTPHHEDEVHTGGDTHVAERKANRMAMVSTPADSEIQTEVSPQQKTPKSTRSVHKARPAPKSKPVNEPTPPKPQPKRYKLKKKVAPEMPPADGASSPDHSSPSPTSRPESTTPSTSPGPTSSKSSSPAKPYTRRELHKRKPLPSIGNKTPPQSRKVVTLANRTPLAPPQRKQKPQLHKKRLIKPPHHVATLGYYAQAVQFVPADVIEQGCPSPTYRNYWDAGGEHDKSTAGEDELSPELQRAKERITVVKTERRRMHIVRAKVEAARVIQRAFRAWVSRGKPRPPPTTEKRNHNRRGGKINTGLDKWNRPIKQPPSTIRRAAGRTTSAFMFGDKPPDKNMQIAALTIQLAWRQYLRRRGPATRTLQIASTRRRPRPLQANSPEVLKAKATIRKMREVNLYTHRQPMMQWRPRKQAPVHRAPAVKIPSISITAFNLAFDTYFPPDVKARFAKQANSMAQSEADADKILAEIHNRKSKEQSLSPTVRRSFIPDHARGRPVSLTKLPVY